MSSLSEAREWELGVQARQLLPAAQLNVTVSGHLAHRKEFPSSCCHPLRVQQACHPTRKGTGCACRERAAIQQCRCDPEPRATWPFLNSCRQQASPSSWQWTWRFHPPWMSLLLGYVHSPRSQMNFRWPQRSTSLRERNIQLEVLKSNSRATFWPAWRRPTRRRGCFCQQQSATFRQDWRTFSQHRIRDRNHGSGTIVSAVHGADSWPLSAQSLPITHLFAICSNWPDRWQVGLSRRVSGTFSAIPALASARCLRSVREGRFDVTIFLGACSPPSEPRTSSVSSAMSAPRMCAVLVATASKAEVKPCGSSTETGATTLLPKFEGQLEELPSSREWTGTVPLNRQPEIWDADWMDRTAATCGLTVVGHVFSGTR